MSQEITRKRKGYSDETGYVVKRKKISEDTEEVLQHDIDATQNRAPLSWFSEQRKIIEMAYEEDKSEILQSLLSRSSTLRELNMSFLDIRKEDIEGMLAQILNTSPLETLRLDHLYTTLSAMQIFLDALEQLPTLRTLEFNGLFLNGNRQETTTPTIFTALQKLNLHSLCLYHSSFIPPSHEDAQSLAIALQKFTNLHTLKILHSRMSFETLNVLAPTIEHLTHLSQLSLTDANIDARNMLVLAPALRQLKELKALGLNSNPLGPNGMTILTTELTNLAKLHTLKLAHVQMGAAGGDSLVTFITTRDNFYALDVSGNNIGSNKMVELIYALKHHTNLHMLHIQGNQTDNTGLRHLADLLEYSKICSLNILDRNAPLRAEGLESIIDIIPKCTNLQDLILGPIKKHMEARLLKAVKDSCITSLVYHNNDDDHFFIHDEIKTALQYNRDTRTQLLGVDDVLMAVFDDYNRHDSNIAVALYREYSQIMALSKEIPSIMNDIRTRIDEDPTFSADDPTHLQQILDALALLTQNKAARREPDEEEDNYIDDDPLGVNEEHDDAIAPQAHLAGDNGAHALPDSEF